MKTLVSFKISIVSLCAFLILGFYSNSLSGQDYDNCSNARLLHCGGYDFHSTEDATVSTFPAPSCAGGGLKDVFYRFDALPGYTYRITVLGNFYDGVILAYSGDCENPVEIACADNEWTTNALEEIEVTVPFAQSILLRTYSWSADGDTFTIRLECEASENDLCNNAAEIFPLYWGSSSNVYQGSTISATSNSGPYPSCSLGGSMNDLFYTIKTNPGMDYTISVNGDNYDGVLAAYTGNCGGTLTEIACADSGLEDGIEESITFSVEEEQYVLIQTYDYNASGGDFELSCKARPNNDYCTDATQLTCGDSFLGSTTDATYTDMAYASCYSPFEPRDVFYTIDAVPGNLYQLTAINLGNFSGKMVAYSGFNGVCDENLNEIACNTVSGYSTPVILEFSVPTAQAILIRTFGIDLGFSIFNISLDCLPLYNDCDYALPIICGTPVSGSTLGATESDIPTPSCGSGAPADVFYALDALPNITYTATINGENYDAIIAAYIGECDGTLTELACADDGFGSNNPETIEFSVESAQTVLIRTYDWFANQGDFTLEITCENENQSCADAIPIELYGQSECPDNAVIYSNEGSSTSISTCDDDISPHTIFFSFNSGSNHSVNFNFNDITITDWIVQLVENCNGDIQYCGIGINSVNVAVNPNTEYTLTVSTNSFFGSTGTFALCATGLNDFCVEIDDFIGEPCDDGDPDTFNDEIQENCTCAGTTEISALINGSISWNASCGSQSAVVSIYDSSTGAHISDYPTSINSSGQFAVNFNQAGTFDVTLKVPGYLSVSLIDRSIIAGSNTLVFGAPLPGDLNNDNQINIADISFMTAAFGSAIGDPDFNPLADFNCDGAINISDVSAMTANYGMSGSKPTNI